MTMITLDNAQQDTAATCPRCCRANCPVVWIPCDRKTIDGKPRLTDETTAEAYKIACRAIGEVVALGRFDTHSRHQDHYARTPARHPKLSMLSIRTVAYLRAYRRLIDDSTIPIGQRYRAADEVASELAHYLSIDIDIILGTTSRYKAEADRALDDTIGDLCPGCRGTMTAKDGPALRDDYRCAACLEKGVEP